MDEQEFIEAYKEALIWSAPEEDGSSLDGIVMSTEAVRVIESDCKAFLWVASGLIEGARDEAQPYDGNLWAQAGHDFCLTRNHDGVGFWEIPDWPEECGEILTKIAHSFGEAHVYRGDDGFGYIS